MMVNKAACWGAVLLCLGGSVVAQPSLPPFFAGMEMLEENDCPSFTVSYFATPAISRKELTDSRNEKGWGYAVIPKPGTRLSEVRVASTEPEILSVNFVITYQIAGQAAREITADVLDHSAPSDSAMIPSALFGEGGIFYAGGSYRTLLSHRTSGASGPGIVSLDDRAPQIFRGSDGSTCTIRAPIVRFRIE